MNTLISIWAALLGVVHIGAGLCGAPKAVIVFGVLFLALGLLQYWENRSEQ